MKLFIHKIQQKENKKIVKNLLNKAPKTTNMRRRLLRSLDEQPYRRTKDQILKFRGYIDNGGLEDRIYGYRLRREQIKLKKDFLMTREQIDYKDVIEYMKKLY